MTQLTLNQAQSEALHETLQYVLPELSFEIADTDLKAFRDKLKAKRDCLKEVLDMLNE